MFYSYKKKSYKSLSNILMALLTDLINYYTIMDVFLAPKTKLVISQPHILYGLLATIGSSGKLVAWFLGIQGIKPRS